MTRYDALRLKLASRLSELEARVHDIESEQGQPLDDDWPEAAAAREDDEVLDGVERETLLEMASIRRALARIQTGAYGVCATCGEPISAARLEALPAAARCIACAKDDHG